MSTIKCSPNPFDILGNSNHDKKFNTNQETIKTLKIIPNSFSRECYNEPIIWALLDDFERIIPWKKKFIGDPTYDEIFAFISPRFKENPGFKQNLFYLKAYNLLKAQIEFNIEYERVFEE